MEGIGVTQNKQKGVKWFRLAAEQGNAEAQKNLGVFYKLKERKSAFSERRLPDYKEAIKWYRLAADQGNADAKEALPRLIDLMQNKCQNEFEKVCEELEREAKEKKEKAEQTAKLKRWMVEGENYRSLFKEDCADKEKPSQCITMQSCWIAAIILENMNDDRIKQFKKTVDGGLLSKGNLDKAMKELKKHMDKDKFLKEKIEQLFMQCAFGSFPLSGFVDSFQR